MRFHLGTICGIAIVILLSVGLWFATESAKQLSKGESVLLFLCIFIIGLFVATIGGPYLIILLWGKKETNQQDNQT